MTEAQSERRQRFDALFAAHSSDIVAYCGWRAGSASDAQDAVAEVFLTAWRRLDEVPEGDAARVWLYATARRVMANQRRSSRRRFALHERLALDAASAPAGTARGGAEEALVHEALRRLGPRDREVLLLAEWEGLSPAQIAAVLGCLTVTARGRLHRARRRFRAVFEELLARDDGEQPSREPSGGAADFHALRPAMRPPTTSLAKEDIEHVRELHALRRANPRTSAGFAQSVEAAADAVRQRRSPQRPPTSSWARARGGHAPAGLERGGVARLSRLPLRRSPPRAAAALF